MRAVVYRCFGRDRRLLYVGCTMHIGARMSSHKSATAWFDEIDAITVEHFTSPEQARAAETAAIKAECPIYNQVHRTVAPRRRREPPDESGWPIEGLTMNRPFVDALVSIESEGRSYNDISRAADVCLSWLQDIATRRIGANIEDAQRLAGALTCSIDVVFPNRDPAYQSARSVETVVAPRYVLAVADDVMQRTGFGASPIPRYRYAADNGVS